MFDKQHQERSEYEMIPAELHVLERQLGAQALAPARIDRDRLMFEAGRAAAGGGAMAGDRAPAPRREARRHWSHSRFWPGATAAMTAATMLAATVALAIALAWPDRPVKVVEVPAPAPERVDASELVVAAETGDSPGAAIEGVVIEVAVIKTDVAGWGVDRHVTQDPWGLSRGGTGGLLTARGFVTARDGGSLAHELPEHRALPEKSPNVRDLMNELLPERAAERATRT